jgi:hypothetical protein
LDERLLIGIDLGSTQHVTVIGYRAWARREDALEVREAAVRESLGVCSEPRPGAPATVTFEAQRVTYEPQGRS